MKPRIAVRALIQRNGKILVIVHTDEKGEFYILPGGRQEPFENLKETLAREVQEEIGAEVRINDVMFIREYMTEDEDQREADSAFHKVDIIFACDLTKEPVATAMGSDFRQQGWTWLPIKELPHVRFFPEAIAQKLNIPEPHQIYIGVTEWK
jgi:8-oxo-dGTP diphosphatase